MNRVWTLIGGAAAFVALLIVLSCFYEVRQTEQALLLQFNAPRQIVTEPGLHTKIPWIQSVVFIDKRLLNLEAPSEEVIAQDKKRLVVDAFARWRILDPLRFYQSLYDTDTAQIRLTSILSSNVRRVLGSQNFAAVLSARREELMREIRDNMNQEAKNFGIKVVDVRIRHADLPAENSQAIYNRMMQERKREANEYRAEGSEISQRIRARAEREVTVLVAEGTRESSILRGQGDAEKTKTLAEAFGQDPDFFAFYRSMQAYEQALPGENTTLITSPNSDFFRYFSHPGAGGGK
ncbi:MAG: protease modulator HflC [Alphaproteobacteria bacterium]|nr:protease modulator HflC [Alphaproteobacteria bacterium]